MDAIEKLFEPYDRQARLFPALLALSPVFIVMICRFGEKVTIGSGIVSLLVACGGLFWIARMARNAGVRVQERMWKPWGGTPTVRHLRHSDSSIDLITKERYHRVLGAGIGKQFPSAAAEKADPAGADQYYRSGIKWLMEQTRDTNKYAHLFKENIAYGFHRNMLGIKPVAIVLNLGCLLAACLWTGLILSAPPYVSLSGLSDWTFEQVVAVLLPLAALILWTFGVTEDSVEKASSAYGERLLQACETLTKPAN